MADLRYVTPNQLRRRANRVRTLVFAAGAPCTLILALLHPLLALPLGIVLCSVWNKQRRLLVGAHGEEKALGIPTAYPGSLTALGDDYVVFNQIRIPWRGLVLEIDHVVVGPNGVFAIECKHLMGEITGDEADERWAQHKFGPGGVCLSHSTRNPVKQVRRATHALANYLRERGIDVWVEPIVVFTHPLARLSATARTVPLLSLAQLAPHIESVTPQFRFRQQGAATRAVLLLRDGHIGATGNAGASGPKHVSYFMRDLLPPRVEAFMNHNLDQARREAAKKTELHDRAPPAPGTISQAQRASRRRPITARRGALSRRSWRRTIVRRQLEIETSDVKETNSDESKN